MTYLMILVMISARNKYNIDDSYFQLFSLHSYSQWLYILIKYMHFVHTSYIAFTAKWSILNFNPCAFTNLYAKLLVFLVSELYTSFVPFNSNSYIFEYMLSYPAVSLFKAS